VLHEGTYRDWLPEHPTIWAFERRLGEDELLIVANVSGQETNVPDGLTGQVLLSNYADVAGTLRPYEARILIKRE
jgi:hypothetical protein